MTTRAIAGLFGLNLGFAVLGLSIVFALRGLPRWQDVLRLAGLGYLVGVAAFGVAWTQLLVVGVPFTGWGIAVSLVGGTLAACVVGVVRRRALPKLARGVPVTPLALLVTAGGVALVGLLLEALFRCGAPAEPAGVRRLGVLGAEGEGALLLRRPGRAGVHDLGRADLPAAPSDSRRGRLPRDGGNRRRHAAPPVLVPARRRRRGPGGLPLPSRPGLGALAVSPRSCSSRPASASAFSRHRPTSSSTCSSCSARCCSRSGSATVAGGGSPPPRCCSRARR